MRLFRLSQVYVLSAVIAALAAPLVSAQEEYADDPSIKTSDKHDLVKKRPVKVVQLFPNATRHEPGIMPTPEMGKDIMQLHTLVDANSNEEAIALGEKMLASPKANHFDRAVAFQGLGYAYFKKGDYAKAAENLQSCLAENAFSNNDQYPTMLNLAQAQINAGQGDAGLATLDRLVNETKLDKPEYNAVRGRVYYTQKNYAAAAQALQKAVDSAPQPDDKVTQLLMLSYFQAKQPERAEKVAQDLLQKHPGDKDLILNLASIYGQAGQNDKAAAMLEDARSRGMLSDANDYRRLYVIYANLPGKEAKTIAVINDGMQKGILKPNAEVYATLAQSYYATNQPAQTIDAYRHADSLSTDGEAGLNLARVLFNERRFPEARTAAQQAQQKGLKKPEDAKMLLAQIDTASGKTANKVTRKKK
jgi:tetratricopeptide (TPR) repeat protein